MKSIINKNLTSKLSTHIVHIKSDTMHPIFVVLFIILKVLAGYCNKASVLILKSLADVVCFRRL